MISDEKAWSKERYYSKKIKLARLRHAPVSEIAKYKRIYSHVTDRLAGLGLVNFLLDKGVDLHLYKARVQMVTYSAASAMGGEPSIFSQAKTDEERRNIQRRMQVRSHMSAGAIGVKPSGKPRASEVYNSIMRGLEDALDHAKNKK